MADYTIDMIHTHYAKVTDQYSIYLEEEEIKEFCQKTNRNWYDTFERQEAMRFLAMQYIQNGQVDYKSTDWTPFLQDDGAPRQQFIEDGIYQEDEEDVDNEAVVG